MLSVVEQSVPWVYPLPVWSDEGLLPPEVGSSALTVARRSEPVRETLGRLASMVERVVVVRGGSTFTGRLVVRVTPLGVLLVGLSSRGVGRVRERDRRMGALRRGETRPVLIVRLLRGGVRVRRRRQVPVKVGRRLGAGRSRRHPGREGPRGGREGERGEPGGTRTPLNTEPAFCLTGQRRDRREGEGGREEGRETGKGEGEAARSFGGEGAERDDPRRRSFSHRLDLTQRLYDFFKTYIDTRRHTKTRIPMIHERSASPDH